MHHVAESGAARIILAVGDTLDLSLGENPSTGYRWQLRSSLNDVLELTSASFETGGEQPGAGGRRTFSFRALAAGDVRVELQRVRGSAPPMSDRDRRSLEVHVTSGGRA